MHNNIFKGFIGNEENCRVWLYIINYLTVKENVNMRKLLLYKRQLAWLIDMMRLISYSENDIIAGGRTNE